MTSTTPTPVTETVNPCPSPSDSSGPQTWTAVPAPRFFRPSRPALLRPVSGRQPPDSSSRSPRVPSPQGPFKSVTLDGVVQGRPWPPPQPLQKACFPSASAPPALGPQSLCTRCPPCLHPLPTVCRPVQVSGPPAVEVRVAEAPALQAPLLRPACLCVPLCLSLWWKTRRLAGTLPGTGCTARALRDRLQ